MDLINNRFLLNFDNYQSPQTDNYAQQQSTTQSTDQNSSESIDQSVDQSVDPGIAQSIDQTTQSNLSADMKAISSDQQNNQINASTNASVNSTDNRATNTSTNSVDKNVAKQGMAYGRADLMCSQINAKLNGNLANQSNNAQSIQSTTTNINQQSDIASGQITTVQGKEVKDILAKAKPGLAIDPHKTPNDNAAQNGWKVLSADERKQFHSLPLTDDKGQQTNLGHFFANSPYDGQHFIIEKGAKLQDFQNIIETLTPAQREGALAWAKRKDIFDSNGVAQKYQVAALSVMQTVSQMSPDKKLAETIRLAAEKLPGDAGEKLKELASPTNLAVMTGMLTAWAASHAFVAGEVIDTVFAGAGLIALGADGIAAAVELGKFAVGTVNASSDQELDIAASHLSQAISIVGVDAIVSLVTHEVAGAVKSGIAKIPPPQGPPGFALAEGTFASGEMAATNIATRMNPTSGGLGTAGAGIFASKMNGSSSGGATPPTITERATAVRDQLTTPEAKAEFDQNLAKASDPDAFLKPHEALIAQRKYMESLSYDQLQENRSRTLRPGETNADMQQRVDTAETELLKRVPGIIEKLGEVPRKVNLINEDPINHGINAHTIDRHGTSIPLRRDPNIKTIEGRLFGDTGWHKAEPNSLKWKSDSAMNNAVNSYIENNWAKIKEDLAFNGRHTGAFDMKQSIGEGFINTTPGNTVPSSTYVQTSYGKIIIKLKPGNPPDFGVITTYPSVNLTPLK